MGKCAEGVSILTCSYARPSSAANWGYHCLTHPLSHGIVCRQIQDTLQGLLIKETLFKNVFLGLV